MENSFASKDEKTWERRMNDAKKRHRPKLQNWSRDQFATTRLQDFLNTRTLNESPCNLTRLRIGRVNVRGCNAENFVKYYEQQYKPCIISGIPSEEGWTATQSWSFDSIRERFKDRLFKVGEDDDGYKIKAKMKYFLQYLFGNKDDSPLYIFDSSYDEDALSKSILQDYKVPSYFNEDLFKLVGEKRRPPYRWFLMGPERSGSCVHLDPLATSAWNTVIVGRKRWVLFPPGTPRAVVKGLEVIKKGEDDEAINYFVDLLPRIKERYGSEVQIMELIQEPGETIYVPGGWWHGVLNLTDTVAITQNFCSSSNFDAVWRATRKGRKKMAVKWLRELGNEYPELAKRAVELNRADGFVMYDKNHPDWAKPKKESKKDKKETTITSATSNDVSKTNSSSSGSSSSVGDVPMKLPAIIPNNSNSTSVVSSSSGKKEKRKKDCTEGEESKKSKKAKKTASSTGSTDDETRSDNSYVY